MVPLLPPVHTVALFCRGGLDIQTLNSTQEILEELGIVATPWAKMTQHPDLILCLGGDGTILRMSSWAAEQGVPVLGINHGHLGFLAAFGNVELRQALEALANGTLPVEERIRLKVEWFRGPKEIETNCGLNEVSIDYNPRRSVITLQVRVDGQEMATYKGNGLLVTTPTGATAYNLAAGGPLLYPTMAAFCITPICPHCVTHRTPVVVNSTNEIEIIYLGPKDRDAVINLDGRGMGSDTQGTLVPGDRIRITGACKPLRLCPPQHGVFRTMHEKLGWGGAP